MLQLCNRATIKRFRLAHDHPFSQAMLSRFEIILVDVFLDIHKWSTYRNHSTTAISAGLPTAFQIAWAAVQCWISP